MLHSGGSKTQKVLPGYLKFSANNTLSAAESLIIVLKFYTVITNWLSFNDMFNRRRMGRGGGFQSPDA